MAEADSVLEADEVKPPIEAPKCVGSQPVGPAYQVGELPADAAAAASGPKTFTHRSVSPNTTA